MPVDISFDPAKREWTLRERGLDFLDAVHVFGGPQFTLVDDRVDYPERRLQTFGLREGRLVLVVWVQTPNGRRVISMRKCNEREQARYRHRVG